MTPRKRDSLLPSIIRGMSVRRPTSQSSRKPILTESPSSPTSNANTEALTAAQNVFDNRDESGIARPPETPGPPVPAKNTPPTSPKKVAFTGVDDETVYTYDAEILIRGLKTSWTVHAARVAAETYPRSTPMLLSPIAIFAQKKLEEAILSVEGCKGTKGKLLDTLMAKVVLKVPVGDRSRGFEDWVEGVLRDALGALSRKEWMAGWEDEDLRGCFSEKGEKGEIVGMEGVLEGTQMVNGIGDGEKDERSMQLD